MTDRHKTSKGKKAAALQAAAPVEAELARLAGLAGEWVEAVEAAAAGIVAAEIAAASAILTPDAPLTDEERAEKERAADAATEAGFDNLPV